VLSEVLTDGDASRLEKRLVRDDRSVTQIGSYLGLMGDPFDVGDPTMLMLQAIGAEDFQAEQVLSAAHEEFDRLATDGPTAGELDRVKARIVATMLHSVDSVLGRALQLSALEQRHGRAELLSELPGLIGAVTDDEVRTAAAMLRPDRRAVIELRPGKDSA
jgi:predicted Zn-dependent peptidase